MNPGDTLRGLDAAGHLWIVVSVPFQDSVAVVNITTHRPGCPDPTVHVDPGEHAFVVRRSCVRYQDAYMNPVDMLADAVEKRIFLKHDPLSADLLLRIQQGSLQSEFTPYEVQDAVRATLGQ